MEFSNNVLILWIKSGSGVGGGGSRGVEWFISLDLHSDFVLFVYEPLSRDAFIFYGFSLYVLESLIDD